jgi:hypothetical protein
LGFVKPWIFTLATVVMAVACVAILIAAAVGST